MRAYSLIPHSELEKIATAFRVYDLQVFLLEHDISFANDPKKIKQIFQDEYRAALKMSAERYDDFNKLAADLMKLLTKEDSIKLAKALLPNK